MHAPGHRIILVAALMLLLSACASQTSAPTPPERLRCMTSQTLVCYGRNASKVDNRLGEIDYCRCEDVLNGL